MSLLLLAHLRTLLLRQPFIDLASGRRFSEVHPLNDLVNISLRNPLSAYSLRSFLSLFARLKSLLLFPLLS